MPCIISTMYKYHVLQFCFWYMGCIENCSTTKHYLSENPSKNLNKNLNKQSIPPCNHTIISSYDSGGKRVFLKELYNI